MRLQVNKWKIHKAHLANELLRAEVNKLLNLEVIRGPQKLLENVYHMK
jgi:hypothetical protein